MSEPVRDPDLEEVFSAEVDRGNFATVEEARAEFDASIDEAIAELDACGEIDGEIVFAELRERYANWPRAAE